MKFLPRSRIILAFLFAFSLVVGSFHNTGIPIVQAAEVQAADAADWSPDYTGYDQIGKDGDSTVKAPFPLVTEAGKAVVSTTGDTLWVDPAGQRFDFLGRDANRQDRGSIIIVVGPEPATPSLIRRWSWVGVTPLPDGKLSGYASSRIINTRLTAMRDPNNHSGLSGGGITGPIDVVVVRYGLIQETRVIYPGQWAAEK